MTVPPSEGRPDAEGGDNPYRPPGPPPSGQTAGARGFPPPYPAGESYPGPRYLGGQYPNTPGTQYPDTRYPQGWPPGQPGAMPYGMPPIGQPPMSPPPRRKGTAWAGVAVAVALIAAAVGFTGWHAATAMPEVEAGTCLYIADFSYTVEEPEVLDCSDERATLRVAATFDDPAVGCPAGPYDQYHHRDGALVCLMLNVEQGDCLSNVATDNPAGYERVRCTDPAAELAVLKVAEGASDPARACSDVEAAFSLAYSEPATVICAAPPKTV